MTMVQTSPEKLLNDSGDHRVITEVPEIRAMLKIIMMIGWVNLLVGLPSVILVLNLRSISLVCTGLLSMLTFWLQRMIVRHISQTHSWTEFGVIAMCGVYFPSFVLWLASNCLIEAILH